MTTPTSYFWLRIAVTPESSESEQYRLMELGAMGTEEEDGPTPVVRAYFGDADAWRTARDAIGDTLLVDSGESPWEDWDRSWRERQTPVEVTERLTVCPPWVPGPDNVETVIRLEAKMAFGTGSHESTRIAALLLEDQIAPGMTVLDVGTGTGILALYAARLGAGFSAGFDIDPVAGPCLRENLDLNPVGKGREPVFYVGTLDALRADARFDLIVVNMIRTETWPYLEDLLARLAPGGRLVFSGQRIEDQPYWMPWLRDHDVGITREQTFGEWWGFAGVLNAGER